MPDSGSDRENGQNQQEHRLLTIFATERIEDYVVLSLALIILILILAFY